MSVSNKKLNQKRSIKTVTLIRAMPTYRATLYAVPLIKKLKINNSLEKQIELKFNKKKYVATLLSLLYRR